MADLCSIPLLVWMLDDDAVVRVLPLKSDFQRLKLRLVVLLLKLRYPAFLSDELLVVSLLASVFAIVQSDFKRVLIW